MVDLISPVIPLAASPNALTASITELRGSIASLSRTLTTGGGVSFPMALLFWKFHEGHPKGFAAPVAEERLFIRQGKYSLQLQLCFAPFED